MKREDFVALPLSLALGLIWEHAPGLSSALADKTCPIPARPPRYDNAIFRSEGVQYASEMDVRGLQYFRMRSLESADKGGKWAEKDRKRATALEYWIAWRLVEPNTAWTGDRNHETVTAAVPSSKPTIYPRAERSTRTTTFDDEPSGPPVDDDDIPFD